MKGNWQLKQQIFLTRLLWLTKGHAKIISTEAEAYILIPAIYNRSREWRNHIFPKMINQKYPHSDIIHKMGTTKKNVVTIEVVSIPNHYL